MKLSCAYGTALVSLSHYYNQKQTHQFNRFPIYPRDQYCSIEIHRQALKAEELEQDSSLTISNLYVRSDSLSRAWKTDSNPAVRKTDKYPDLHHRNLKGSRIQNHTLPEK